MDDAVDCVVKSRCYSCDVGRSGLGSEMEQAECKWCGDEKQAFRIHMWDTSKLSEKLAIVDCGLSGESRKYE